jgi:hypothetical protein
MGRQDHAMIATELAYERTDFADLDRVETDRRFVQDHERRQMDDRLGDADALLVALRQVADQAPADIGQATAALGGVACGAALESLDAVQRRAVIEVLVDRQVAIYRRLLRQVAERAFGRDRLGQQVMAGDADAAAGRRQVARQNLHGGGFAGPVRSQEPQDFAGADSETDRFYGLEIAVETRQIFDLC